MLMIILTMMTMTKIIMAVMMTIMRMIMIILTMKIIMTKIFLTMITMIMIVAGRHNSNSEKLIFWLYNAFKPPLLDHIYITIDYALYALCRPNRDTREELQAVVDKKKSSKLS